MNTTKSNSVDMSPHRIQCSAVKKNPFVYFILLSVSLLAGCVGERYEQTEHLEFKAEKHRPVAIDMHLHAGTPYFPGAQIPEFIRDPMEGPVDEVAKRIARQMDNAEVGMVLLMGMPVENVDLADPLGVQRGLDIAALLPPGSIKQIGVAEPKKMMKVDEYLTSVRKQLEAYRKEIVAFKVYTGMHGSALDAGYQPYYDLAKEFGIPVIFHTGTGGGPALALDTHPYVIDKIALENPEMKVILAHCGVPNFVDAAHVALKNNNVWLDLSGFVVITPEYTEEQFKAI